MAKDEPKDLEARFAELAAKNASIEERNAQLMAMLEAKFEAQPQATGIDAATLKAILTETTAAASRGSELLASKMKPENVDHRHIGPFEHPDGGIANPKPELLRETTYVGGRIRLDELTYPEALAVNALNASLSRAQRRVCRDGKWVAQVSEDDQRLTIRIPVKNIDDRSDLPPMIQIMQELTSGERAQDVGELAQELALLKSQMAKLQPVAV